MNLARVILLGIWHFVLLLIVTLLLLIFVPPTLQYVKQASGRFEQDLIQLRSIREARNSLTDTIEKEFNSVQRRLEAMDRLAREGLTDSIRKRIEAIDHERSVRAAGPTKPWWNLGITKNGLDVEALRERALTSMHDELLQQERQVLRSLLSLQAVTLDAPAELKQLWKQHDEAYKAYLANKAAQVELKNSDWLRSYKVWFTPANRALRSLEEEGIRLLADNQAASQRYDKKERQIQAMQGFKTSVMSFDSEPFLAPLLDRESAVNDAIKLNWLGSVIVQAPGTLREYLPKALLIVIAVILTPVLIKATLYYLFAPLASRRKAIALLPERAGEIEDLDALESHGAKPHSSVSKSIVIDQSSELLVHPEYLQSSPRGSVNKTRWLLSGRYWLSSIAAGLFMITRMRIEKPMSVVVSATRDPLSEVGAIGIPAGSCIVLQPRHLVGLLQLRDQPIRISSHWRLGSLHAWLTFQLRFLVFHGPGKLIVKGCRGVRVERADSGRNINQAATIGFSANLAYTSRRSETFIGYLSGKQPLLHDSFAGTQGYCIYQEMPHKGVRSGVTGRGLEGFTDALLKVFGV